MPRLWSERTHSIEEQRIERTPIVEVIKRHRRVIILSALLQAPFYVFTAFVFFCGTGTLQVWRDFIAVLIAAGTDRIRCTTHTSPCLGRC
ncbi:MAG TPA: hypothetical protein VG758_01750 [Hyphomicrobiaceae bacterium]|nr:hypothetical protein [Hyphomicrobiaceae bacterium]